MSNFILATPNDDGTLTTGNELTAMPASNLLRMQPKDKWRTSGTANVYLVYDLGAAVAVQIISLLYTNAADGDTWRIRAASTEAGLTSSPGYDSGSVAIWDNAWPADQDPIHAIHWLSSAQSFQWWRIDVTTSNSYFEAGRLYINDVWQPDINISYGWSIQRQDPTLKNRSVGSSLYADERDSWRELSVRLQTQSEDALYNNLYEIQRRRGTGRDLLAIRDPDATDHLIAQTVYGVFNGLQPIINPNFNLFSARLTIEELI